MLNAVELAALALKVLDMQKRYFATRDHAVLIESKTLETRLRFECNEVMSKQDNLFPGDGPGNVVRHDPAAGWPTEER